MIRLRCDDRPTIGKRVNLMHAIRPAVSADREAVEAVVRTAYCVYIDRITRKPGPMMDDYEALIQQGHVYVLDDEGGIAGLVVLIP